jgi:tripartite-type tricarboxylate transporter receptor subunit TctC
MPSNALRLAGALLALTLSAPPLVAQDYPSRSIRLIIAANAGGPQDILGRALGESLRPRIGQNLIIENKPGGNFIIGAQACKNAPPDGYTICMFSISAISINPHLYSNMGYDPDKDFEPVINLGSARSVMLMHGSIPVDTVKELGPWSRQNPDRLNYASFGVGGAAHLLLEWVKYTIRAKMTHVPFPGAAPALLAFERGDLHILNPIPIPQVVEIIKTGRGKGLLAFGGKIPELPAVPTPTEAGLPPLMFDNWFGIFAPAGMPPERIALLNREMVALVKDPPFRDRYIEGLGFAAIGNSVEEFKKSLPGYRDHAGELVRLSGIRQTEAPR